MESIRWPVEVHESGNISWSPWCWRGVCGTSVVALNSIEERLCSRTWLGERCAMSNIETIEADEVMGGRALQLTHVHVQ